MNLVTFPFDKFLRRVLWRISNLHVRSCCFKTWHLWFQNDGSLKVIFQVIEDISLCSKSWQGTITRFLSTNCILSFCVQLGRKCLIWNYFDSFGETFRVRFRPEPKSDFGEWKILIFCVSFRKNNLNFIAKNQTLNFDFWR